MRILIVSDLHHDMWCESGRDPFAGSEALFSELDHLLIAGDLANDPITRWKLVFERLGQMMDLGRVSVFPGNHDFYSFQFDREEKFAEMAESFGVNYAQKSVLPIGGARLICATLWTDLDLGSGRVLNEPALLLGLNDYKEITVAADGPRRLIPSDVAGRHLDHRRWIEEQLMRPFDGRTFVVTHHAPHPSVLGNHPFGLEAAFASDLEGLIAEARPDTWFFGHCHDAHNTELHGTKLVNVSLGYAGEVADPSVALRKLVFEV